MSKMIKVRTPILALILFVFAVGQVVAEDTVRTLFIPIPGDEKTLSTLTSVSIPVTALRASSGATLEFDSGLQIILQSNGNTAFGTTFVIPEDHAPNTDIFVDIHVWNPSINGACQASIRKNYGRYYREGTEWDASGEFNTDSVFPAFIAGDRTIVHTFSFGAAAGAGDAIGFGMYRNGESSSDNCGDVGLVGLNIRYQRQ
jgi:hypothetical protein